MQPNFQKQSSNKTIKWYKTQKDSESYQTDGSDIYPADIESDN